MSESNDKKSLSTTPEVAKMFGLNPSEDNTENGAAPDGNGFSKIVGNLYVKDLPVAASEPAPSQSGPRGHNAAAPSMEHDRIGTETAAKPLLVLRILRSITPYLVIFTMGIFLYLFFFTNVDFTGIFKTQAKVQTPQQSSLQKLQSQNLDGYNKWIAQFYYDVSDPNVLDPNADNSGNGLTNFQKYLLNLNPKAFDTLGLGLADSESLAKGYNPLTGNRLTDSQKQIVDQYFDMEVIMNRLALAQMNRAQVAGAATSGNSASAQNSGNPQVAPASSGLDIDTAKPGLLEIPDLKVSVPVIWTTDTKNFDADLRSGVVHYPGTAMPGQVGTAYISGHSSNYAWAKGSYNHVFTQLGDLGKDASFKVTVTLKSGKQAVLYYVVVGSQQYNPKDQAQFTNASKSVMALSTCWPVGSTSKRLVVYGELTQVQQ
jgi:LPXTG-site transpeptidase (sortase) family protein